MTTWVNEYLANSRGYTPTAEQRKQSGSIDSIIAACNSVAEQLRKGTNTK